MGRIPLSALVQGAFVLLIGLSIFQGAAINLSSFGLAPVVIVQMLLVFIWICGAVHGSLPLYWWADRRIGLLLLALASYSLISIVLFPRFFAGVPVYSPRLGIDSQVGNETPLSFTISNIAQLAYLVLNSLMVAAVLATASKRWHEPVWKAFAAAGLVVALTALYEKAAAVWELPFPHGLLHSNAFQYQGFEQTIEGAQRISATMAEPSLAGNVLGAYFAYFLTRSAVGGRWASRTLLAAAVCLAATVVTTSSLGYVQILLALGFVALSAGRSLLRFFYFMLALAASAAALALALLPLIQLVLLSKIESSSFVARLAADVHAFRIFAETFGLGAGLGSNRPSSFLAYLASNLGVVGTIIFVALVVLLLIPYVRCWDALSPRQAGLVGAFLVALAGKVIASPDPNFWWFWVLLTMLAVFAPGRAATPGMLAASGLPRPAAAGARPVHPSGALH